MCVLKNIRRVIILIKLKVKDKEESEVHLLVAWDKNPVLSEDCTTFYIVKALYTVLK